MSEQLAIKISKVCCNRLLLAYSSKFVTLTFVFVSQTIFCCEAVLRPSPAALGGNCPLCSPVSYATEDVPAPLAPLPSNRWHLSCDGCLVAKCKGKVFPYSLPNVGPGADPGVQAVSPQVT